MSTAYAKATVKIADELFLIVALLHKEQPDKPSFTMKEVLDRASFEGLGGLPGSLRAHASGHAAANRDPKGSGGYRMIFVEPDKRIRLLRSSDYVHPGRHQKFFPDPNEVPATYHELLKWSKARYAGEPEKPARWLDGLHQLRGLGSEVWAGTDPDAYVRELREGWE